MPLAEAIPKAKKVAPATKVLVPGGRALNMKVISASISSPPAMTPAWLVRLRPRGGLAPA